MSTIITAPPEIANQLRTGSLTILGDAAETVLSLIGLPERERHPEWYVEPRERFERTCALLDTIAWGKPEQPSAARIDLDEHRWALFAALDTMLAIGEADENEADAIDADRAQRGEPPKRETTIKHVLALREFATAVKELTDIPGTSEEVSE